MEDTPDSQRETGRDSQMRVNIKTLTNDEYHLDVSVQTTVRAFKELLEDKAGVSSSLQRLIYRGRVLNDEKLLTEYGIQEGHTVHMVARPEGALQPSQEETQQPRRAEAQPQTHRVAIGAVLPGDDQTAGVADINRVSYLLTMRLQWLDMDFAVVLKSQQMFLLDSVFSK
ncbi:hypothetical protein CYMTET_24268 [Cymbomonas tetramitiformis]|uniref:Ubiquitin-like domain-containing protein n=1 Tax=Cymbomonas tetramitiformis TaxID=36881 RepID=A0AAE0FW50_9CHLO|nr:hypothetical protein CYMTET_24268 [Cymbomonas tetramitiformis]